MRAVKNFFVEQGLNVRQLGLSGILACSIAVAGCGAKKIDGEYYFYDDRQIFVENHRHHRNQPKPSYRLMPDPFLFAKAAVAPIVWTIKGYPDMRRSRTNHLHSIQGGMVWHAEKINPPTAYELFGRTYSYRKGLYGTYSDKQKYEKRSPFFTSLDYHEVEVLYEDEGVFRRGLAVAKANADDSVYAVFPYSGEFQLINIDKIIGVIYIYAKNYHRNYRIVEFTKKDILPFSFDKNLPASPSDQGFEDGVSYWGRPHKVYSNGMSLVEIPSLERMVLIKDGVVFY